MEADNNTPISRKDKEVIPLEEDDGVVFRDNRENVRHSRRLNSERTPTAVVSEVFAFLSNPSMALENLDNLDGEDQLCGKVRPNIENPVKKYPEASTVCSRIISRKEQDSGFASLERHANGDFKNMPYNDFVAEGDDEDADAVNSKAFPGQKKSSSDSCFDEAEFDQSYIVTGSSLQNDMEYDELNESELSLCESESGGEDKTRQTESSRVVYSQEDSIDSTAASINHLADDSYSHVNKGLSASQNQGRTKKPFSCKIVEMPEGSTCVPSKTSEHEVITLNFSKQGNKYEGLKNAPVGSSVAEERPRYSSLIDSYYDFINVMPDGQVSDDFGDDFDGNTVENLLESMALSEHDYEDDNSVTAPLEPSAPSEQDYDLIDMPLPQDNSPEPSASVVSPGSSNDIPVKAEGENGSMTNVMRRSKLEKNPSVELASDDSSDEDIGIYAESFRRSHWIRVSQEGKLSLNADNASPSATLKSNSSISEAVDLDESLSPKADEVFADPLSYLAKGKFHKRSDSTTTTTSEREFKRHYVSRRKCLIQRADSQQEYHRLSARVYDHDKMVVIERQRASEDLGLHLLNSHPAYITSIDPDSPAARAGLVEGQILVSVNDQNVLTMDHQEIIQLIQTSKGNISLGVANSDFQPVRDLQAAIMSGYMLKLGNSSFMKMWKKRYFILRQDNCLYYYKHEQDTDPLGALPLCGYTISRHTDTSRDFCFKAEKYGARTYYFMTDSRDQMTEWVGALTEAAARSKKRKESFLSVSSHNVSLPALDIRRPECTGFLGKLSPSRRHWRKRYCILKDACVYYYKDVNSLSALGVAHLHGYKVDVEAIARRKYSFSLQPPEKKMRVFIFSADNETDKKRWVESLIHSIQRWVLADVDC
ncbi:uncharacterized protein LOC106073904 [Biomphalaria glabrata]|uniref:Uncharacterized protein LOC106073904 n=1 Tax=Biomphalaria glabrata TaxID=6526 RepID=A0A9W2ZBT1_BIOGL|nr:uncharacterized protein LOC106073904 [Biomphalaria glabrata]